MIAVPLEFSQGWVEGRYPDITDVLGALIGATFGAWTGHVARDGKRLTGLLNTN